VTEERDKSKDDVDGNVNHTTSEEKIEGVNDDDFPQ